MILGDSQKFSDSSVQGEVGTDNLKAPSYSDMVGGLWSVEVGSNQRLTWLSLELDIFSLVIHKGF